MNYYSDLFSPETARAFKRSKQNVSGFRISRKTYTENKKIGPGDRLICYVTRLMRFVGVLEIKSKYFIDESPIFTDKNDPFILRFSVEPLVWLPLEKAIPIHDDIIWNNLSTTKNLNKDIHGFVYKARLASSPFLWSKEDGLYIERILLQQARELRDFPFSDVDLRKLNTTDVRRIAKNKEKASSLLNRDVSDSLRSGLVRTLQKPAEIYEWPIRNRSINLLHALQNPTNPYPYNNKLNPAPGSIILFRSVEDRAFIAIGFVISSNHSSKQEQQKMKTIFKHSYTKGFYLHSFVFKNFRVRLRNVGMESHSVPTRISKEDFLRVFQRAMLQIRETNGDQSKIEKPAA